MNTTCETNTNIETTPTIREKCTYSNSKFNFTMKYDNDTLTIFAVHHKTFEGWNLIANINDKSSITSNSDIFAINSVSIRTLFDMVCGKNGYNAKYPRKDMYDILKIKVEHPELCAKISFNLTEEKNEVFRHYRQIKYLMKENKKLNSKIEELEKSIKRLWKIKENKSPEENNRRGRRRSRSISRSVRKRKGSGTKYRKKSK